MGEVVEGHSLGDSDAAMPLLLDGEKRQWKWDGDSDDADGAYCPQQVLVRNLIRVFLRDGGDLRFEAEDVSLHDVDSADPVVRYRDATGSARTVSCDLVAGSDGFRGVSRTAIPPASSPARRTSSGTPGSPSWPRCPRTPGRAGGALRGFAAQITRGPNASRLYLQCPLTDTVEQWPDERVWSELHARFGESVTRGRSRASRSCRCAGRLQPHELRRAPPPRGRGAPHLPDERGGYEPRAP
ncbi:FAD-dependent monooxygenase [Streptomyces sp. M19]